ncbi:hypothetical protein [Geomonas subterranea]|uniref:hypothetical protein n=1 Tax=Geomonas subterranea TaxID=2847989 RepID=UPI001CD42A16|nr:hypothetical protein [Geomonas fuzhouensis]
MNVVMKKILDSIKNIFGSRAAKAVTASCLFAAAVYAAAANAPIVKVGAHSTTYTYTDIEEVHSFNADLSSLGPKSKRVAASRDAVFQSLMLAGVEKEILDARKIPQGDKDRITLDIISSSPYGGLLEKERAKLGDERFYKLFIQPVVVDRVFGEYYLAKDSSRNTAVSALKVAQSEGLTVAASKFGSKVQRRAVPVTKETAPLVEEAKKSIGAIFPKFIEEPTGYAVMQIIDIAEAQMTADVVVIPRQQIGEFIQQELVDAKVPVTDYFYSWFRVSRLKEQGGFLAKVEPKAEKKGE